LPDDLALRLDDAASRIDRSKSWIVRQAVAEWLAEDQRRYEMTLEALKDVDEGRTFSQEEIELWFEQKKSERRKQAGAK
jgi:predicted transcriptional regulator